MAWPGLHDRESMLRGQGASMSLEEMHHSYEHHLSHAQDQIDDLEARLGRAVEVTAYASARRQKGHSPMIRIFGNTGFLGDGRTYVDLEDTISTIRNAELTCRVLEAEGKLKNLTTSQVIGLLAEQFERCREVELA